MAVLLSNSMVKKYIWNFQISLDFSSTLVKMWLNKIKLKNLQINSSKKSLDNFTFVANNMKDDNTFRVLCE